MDNTTNEEFNKRYAGLVGLQKPTITSKVTSNLRLEALKLAYQTANDIKYFKSAYDYKMSDTDFETDLHKIFKLADLNLKYIMDEPDASISTPEDEDCE